MYPGVWLVCKWELSRCSKVVFPEPAIPAYGKKRVHTDNLVTALRSCEPTVSLARHTYHKHDGRFCIVRSTAARCFFSLTATIRHGRSAGGTPAKAERSSGARDQPFCKSDTLELRSVKGLLLVKGAEPRAGVRCTHCQKQSQLSFEEIKRHAHTHARHAQACLCSSSPPMFVVKHSSRFHK